MKFTFELSPEQMDELAEALAKKLNKKPMTIAEFADRVGESKSTIRRKVTAGVILKLPVPGDIKISPAELDRYCAGKPLAS